MGAGHDSPEIWRRLETFCEKNKHKDSIEDRGRLHAYRLVETLGGQGDSASRTLAILSRRIDNVKGHPMLWMEPLASPGNRLEGIARLFWLSIGAAGRQSPQLWFKDRNSDLHHLGRSRIGLQMGRDQARIGPDYDVGFFAGAAAGG